MSAPGPEDSQTQGQVEGQVEAQLEGQRQVQGQGVASAILSLIKANKVLWAGSALMASVLHYVLALLPALVVRQLLDRLVASPRLDSEIVQLLLLLGGIYASRGVTLMLAGLVERASVNSAGILLRRNLLAAVLRRPAARALPESTGDAVGRFTYDTERVTGIYTWVADPLGQALTLLFALWVLSRISLGLTLAVALPVAVAAGLGNAFAHRAKFAREALQRELGRRTGVLGDLFSGVAAVQLGGARTAAVAHLHRSNERVRKAVLRDILVSESIQTFSAQIGELGIALLLFLIAGELRGGELSIGDLALFVSYVGQLASISGAAGWVSAQVSQARVSLGRLAELAPEEEPSVLTATHPIHLRGSLSPEPTGAAIGSRDSSGADRLQELHVAGLTCLHGETAAGVSDVDLSLRAGTVTVVTGEVGSGKTTLLRAVLGLLPVQRGEVLWNGRTVLPATDLVPPRVAYSPQVPRCFTASLGDNIALGHPVSEDDLRRSLRGAVLDDDLGGLPNGLATEVGPRGLRLSGGQLLRTSAARMLVRNADLNVVDDLSSGLDVDTEAELWRRLRHAGGTWLIVSHRPAALALADQIVVLEGGRVVAIGTPAEVAAHPFIRRVRTGRAETSGAEGTGASAASTEEYQ